MFFILTVIIVFGLLVGNEVWWRKRHPDSELSRKFVHITVGSFVAVWPFFLSWNEIRLLSLAFLIVVSVSKQLHIFRAIHSVQRPTYGELFFALAVGGVTFVTHSKGIYLAAILQMSLADGLAAVVGVRFGFKHAYKVFGHTKTVVGSLTFFVVSLTILLLFKQHAGMPLAVPGLLSISVAATLIENAGVEGLDNILVPLVVAVGLRLMS